MDKYSLNNIDKVQLAINLGLGYNQLIKYRPNDPIKFLNHKDFIDDINTNPQYKRAQLSGLPILDRFVELNYTKENKNYSILLDTVLIDVERTRHIVKNEVIGIQGTFKEFINSGDHSITITGTIAGENRYVYDGTALVDLVTICNIEDSIDISNDYLSSVWGIHSIVIESFSLAQSPKFSNIILYTLNCISDYSDNYYKITSIYA